MDKEELSEIVWQAPEFIYYVKDISWYWLSIIIAGILALFSLWQKNFLFTIFLVIAEGMLILWAKEFPKNIQFKIDKKGIGIGGRQFHRYEDLEGFHLIEEKDGWAELVLRTKSKIQPHLKILCFPKDLSAIREFLKKYLPEMEYQESLSDHFFRIIGF